MSDFTVTEIVLALILSIYISLNFIGWRVDVMPARMVDEIDITHVWWKEHLYARQPKDTHDVLTEVAIERLKRGEGIDYVVP